jgi:hypothetical protein
LLFLSLTEVIPSLPDCRSCARHPHLPHPFGSKCWLHSYKCTHLPESLPGYGYGAVM